MRARAQLNRVLVVPALAAGLPAVAALERIRPGAGRSLARALVGGVARVSGIRFETRGAPPAAPGRPLVLVANHTSLLDIPALLAACPDARFLAAADLFGIPLLAPAMRALGAVAVDRRSGGGRRDLDRILEAGLPDVLVAFPEGGIGPGAGSPRTGGGGSRGRWKTGAFALAVAARAVVVPVAISGAAAVLPPGSRLAPGPGRVVVEFLAPIDAGAPDAPDRRTLRDRSESAVRRALARPAA